MRAAVGLSFAGLMIAGGATVQAQAKFPPDKFENLQILPRDAPPGVVITAMTNFTRARRAVSVLPRRRGGSAARAVRLRV